MSLFFRGVFILSFLWGCGGGMEAGHPSAGSFVLSVQGEHLSAKIEKAPLGKVLEDLARQAKIKVSLMGSVGEEKVSAEFKGLALEDGIRRILEGKNYVLTYAQDPSSGGPGALMKVIGIRVIPRGESASLAKANKESGMATAGDDTRQGQFYSVERLMWDALQAPMPSVRAAALEALADEDEDLVGEEEEGVVLQTLVAGLNDEDPEVREVVIEGLKEVGGPVPIEPLAKVALEDTNPQLRRDALELLVETDGKTALDFVRQALKDPDLQVRHLAQEMLEELR